MCIFFGRLRATSSPCFGAICIQSTLAAPYVPNDPCLYNSFLTQATFSPNDQFIQHITKQALAQTTSQCNSNANWGNFRLCCALQQRHCQIMTLMMMLIGPNLGCGLVEVAVSMWPLSVQECSSISWSDLKSPAPTYNTGEGEGDNFPAFLVLNSSFKITQLPEGQRILTMISYKTNWNSQWFQWKIVILHRYGTFGQPCIE